MDYSYFAAMNAQPPYKYMGALPPTPDHTNVPSSEEAFPSESPPVQDFQVAQFPTFDPTFNPQFDANGLLTAQPQPQPHSQSPPNVSAPGQVPMASSLNGVEHIALNGTASSNVTNTNGEMNGDDQNRSSSEDKEALTPVMSRRKEQNRAAQRAFRERKDRHLKDIEQKLSTLETTSTTLSTDNDRLKRELAQLSMENEILRATTTLATQQQQQAQSAAAPLVALGPQTYSPTDFYTTLSAAHPNLRRILDGHASPAAGVAATPVLHRITVSAATGERLFGAAATWDYIMGHELTQRGLVDVGKVTERLQAKAKCDGTGPAFEERDIREAVEGSAAEHEGRDELI